MAEHPWPLTLASLFPKASIGGRPAGSYQSTNLLQRGGREAEMGKKVKENIVSNVKKLHGDR